MFRRRQKSPVPPVRENIALPAAEFSVLRLAAMAIDVRGQLAPHDIRMIPSLGTALDALQTVFEEMGWGRPVSSHDPPRDKSVRHRVSD